MAVLTTLLTGVYVCASCGSRRPISYPEYRYAAVVKMRKRCGRPIPTHFGGRSCGAMAELERMHLYAVDGKYIQFEKHHFLIGVVSDLADG